MNWRTVGIICVVLVALALSVGVGFKLTQETESQRAREIDNKTFEPHMLFGCASYKVMMAKERPVSKAKPKPKPKEKPLAH